jgi:hypothetical protein
MIMIDDVDKQFQSVLKASFERSLAQQRSLAVEIRCCAMLLDSSLPRVGACRMRR